MSFKDRVSQYPNRKRLNVVSIGYDAGGNIEHLVVDMERDDGNVSTVGTKLKSSELLQGLVDIENNGINPVDLVNIHDAQSRYYNFKAAIENSVVFEFSYTGPPIGAAVECSNLFAASVQELPNLIKVTFTETNAINNITQIIQELYTINFFLISSQELVQSTYITMRIVPPSMNPND